MRQGTSPRDPKCVATKCIFTVNIDMMVAYDCINNAQPTKIAFMYFL